MRNKKPLIVLLAFVVILLSLFIYKTSDIYPFLFHLVFDKGVSLKQTNNNINILLLGIGGGTHDGPNLTDTIILATINKKNDKVVLTSIPRDLWVPELTTDIKKINVSYADGEAKKKGGGLIQTKAIVSKITGQEVDYAVRIDFSGFVKAVDIIGGLDVNVDNAFDDFAYPISGKENDNCGFTDIEIQDFIATSSSETEIQQKFSCRYKQLHFNKGFTHMDGETALEYVRSRHALGVEGSDFSRSIRQEKVIKAFKDKLLSAQTLINPIKLLSLYDVVRGSIDTDINQSELDDFVRLSQQLTNIKIVSAVLDTGDAESNREGLLINPPASNEYDYSWVLIPRTGNGSYTEIQNYISCEIQKDNCIVTAKPQN